MTIKDDPQEIARVQMLEQLQDDISSYLLDHCPDDQTWEDFDPGVDALRTKVQELLGERA